MTNSSEHLSTAKVHQRLTFLIQMLMPQKLTTTLRANIGRRIAIRHARRSASFVAQCWGFVRVRYLCLKPAFANRHGSEAFEPGPNQAEAGPVNHHAARGLVQLGQGL